MTDNNRLIKSQSLLSINIQPHNTKATFIDGIENRYRFLASGAIKTNRNSFMEEAFVSVNQSIKKISKVTGKQFLEDDGQLISPNRADGSGVDLFTTTISPSEPLKVVLMGLLDDVSLESARKLVNSTYSQITETYSLYNTTKFETQLDDMVRNKPNLILVVGGTNGGAKKPVLDLLEKLKTFLNLFPEGKRPEVLYAGNTDLAETAVDMIQEIAPIYTSANIRPSLETENLGPVEKRYMNIITSHLARTISGVSDLNNWSGGNIFPNSYTLGRATRFFSKIISGNKPRSVLCVHFGAVSTVIASSHDGSLNLNTLSQLGSRFGFDKIFDKDNLTKIKNWIPFPISTNEINDYLHNMILHSSTIATTPNESSLENAIYREMLDYSITSVSKDFDKRIKSISPDHLPLFDLIILSGSALSEIPKFSSSLLTILDAIQPTGFQQIILDKNNLLTLLGSSMKINPDLAAQMILDPIAFSNLGFVASPVSTARAGTPILRVRIAYETGHENTIIFKKGNIYKIPLPVGQKAKILLEPLNRADLGYGPGAILPSKMVVGGPFGIVIDARGRPVSLPKKANDRYSTLLGWNNNLVSK